MISMLNKNSRGFTLLEAFLAAFLFVTSVAAIFVTMNALRKPAVNNERMLEGALILKDFLEELRSKVDHREFDNPMVFTNGVHNPDPVVGPTSGIPFTIQYNVVTEASGVKRVTATVTWPDTLN